MKETVKSGSTTRSTVVPLATVVLLLEW